MIVTLHPQIRIQKLTVGNDKAPLLVIDNFVADADRLVRRAATRMYVPIGRYYPGIRAEAPLSYQQLFTVQLRDLLFDYFKLQGSRMTFSMCHYSLVTTRTEKLEFLQRIPHFDSSNRNALASVHYLFHGDLGGTAFYRHRSTGFESIDETRKARYLEILNEQAAGPDAPSPGYIDGDTPLFEQTAKQAGVFNRILIYPRNILHSGDLSPNFVPDPNPATGRLSINSFLDVVP
ncbi:MAG: DUF6445 family protein [Povalibacter sp.]